MRVDDGGDTRRFERSVAKILDKATQMRMDECVNTHRFNRLDPSVVPKTG